MNNKIHATKLIILFLICFAQISIAQVNVTEGLVAYYPLHGNALDASGNNHHGFELNGVLYVEAEKGFGAYFDGINNYIQINHIDAFSNEFSISLYVKFLSESGGAIFSKYSYNGSTGKGFTLMGSDNDLTFEGAGSNIFCGVLNDDSYESQKNNFPSYSLEVGKFYHVVATYKSGVSKLYIDGILVDQKNRAHTDGMLYNPYTILLGTYWEDNGYFIVTEPYKENVFNGVIDEVCIYNRALTDNDIELLRKPPLPTHQDCLGAEPLCSNFYSQPDPFIVGQGNYPNEILKYEQCITVEADGEWYYFSPETDGTLQFNLIPNQINVDYDWVLFDLTEGKCEDLQTHPDILTISSNNYGPMNGYGDPTFFGYTGADSDSTGGFAGHCNGPGAVNGPNFNDDIQVYEDRYYMFYLVRCDTEGEHGFTLDFTTSTADIIDDKGPKLNFVIGRNPCGITDITVRFNENVVCSDVTPQTFEITKNGKKIAINAIEGVACSAGTTFGRDFKVITSEALEPGTYKISLVKPVHDGCNNPSDYETMTFTVDDIKITGVSKRNIHGCKGAENGYIKIITNNNDDKLLYSIDDGLSFHDNGGVFYDLKAGTYKAVISNEYGCLSETEVVEITEPDELLIDSVNYQDVLTCYGEDNGQIVIHAKGGKAPLKYSINQSNYYKNNGEFKNVFSGKYTISVKDSSGCVVAGDEISISEPSEIIRQATHKDIETCFGDTLGAIEINAEGGTGILSYSIDRGKTYKPANGVFDSIPAGYYYIRVKDENGCFTKDTTVIILQPTQVKIAATYKTDIKNCYGDSTGQIKIYASGGTEPRVFSIDSGMTWLDNEGAFKNLTAGKYSVFVKDANGCSIKGKDLVLNQPNLLEVTNISKIDIKNCYGDKTGKIEIDAKGGTYPINYSIDSAATFQRSDIFQYIKAGDYNIVVKDGRGCLVDGGNITLSQPTKVKIDSVQHTNILCFGDDSGFAKIFASGGNPGYNFSINSGNDFSNSNLFENLIPTTMPIVVKDQNGCLSDTVNTTISETNKILYQKLNDNIVFRCHGDKNAEISINASGGEGDLSFSIDNGMTYHTSPRFSNLGVGIYDIIIKDEIGCSLYGQQISVNQPAELKIDTIEAKDIVSCFGSSEGQIQIKAHGGTSPLYYSVDSAETFKENPGLFSELYAGKYNVFVKDNNGCRKQWQELSINQPNEIVINKVNKGNLLCHGDAIGKLEIFAEGGTGELAYSINNGTDYFETNNFENLSAGEYIIAIKDANGCIHKSDTVRIVQPSDIIVNQVLATPVPTCYGDTGGKITIDATGGVGQLSFSIDNENFENITGVFDNLKAGIYQVIIKDENNCSFDTSNIIVNQPEPIVIDSLKHENIKCFNGKSGQIEIYPSGGQGVFVFSIDNGETFDDNNGIFNYLESKIYHIAVKDTNNCFAEKDSVYLSQPDSINILINNVKNIETCFGDSVGQISLSALGGVGDFTFSIDSAKKFENKTGMFEDLFAGDYYVAVRDANNCLVFGETQTISQPTKVEIDDIKYKHITCHNDNDGIIEIKALGGQNSYLYSIDGGLNFETNDGIFKKLNGGSYELQVKDINNCLFAGDTIEIVNPENVQISDIHIENVETCFGDSTGVISVEATGGTGDLSYILDEDTVTIENVRFDHLPKNKYQIKVIDENLCFTYSDSILLNEPPELIIDSLRFYDITCNGLTNGRINIFASGGTGSYDFALDGGTIFNKNAGQFKNLSEADYFTAVRDENACLTLGDTIHITEPQEVKVMLDNQADALCNGDANGALDISVVGNPSAKYRYVWSTGENTEDISDLAADTYSVLVTDTLTNHCAAGMFEVLQPDELSAVISASPSECDDTKDGGLSFNISGGTEMYDLIVTNKSNIEVSDLNALYPGLYYYVITDAHGCTLTDNVEVPFGDCEFRIAFPNVITPNGDGKNDKFFFVKDADKSKNIRSFQFVIFNRWGKMIFKSKKWVFNENDLKSSYQGYENEGWDGNTKFGEVTPGVYYFEAKGEGKDGQVKIERSFFHIFK